LKVWAVRAPDNRAFVPIKPQPFQRVDDRLVGLFGRPLLIGILDSKNELAAHVAGEEPIEQGGARAAHMEMPCRARRESDPHLALFFQMGMFGRQRERLGAVAYFTRAHYSRDNIRGNLLQ